MDCFQFAFISERLIDAEPLNLGISKQCTELKSH